MNSVLRLLQGIMNILKSAKVEHGVVTWADGDIDIAPETMYETSYEYPEMQAL